MGRVDGFFSWAINNAHERLIKLLEDGWQVGCPPKEGEGTGTGSGTDGVGE